MFFSNRRTLTHRKRLIKRQKNIIKTEAIKTLASVFIIYSFLFIFSRCGFVGFARTTVRARTQGLRF